MRKNRYEILKQTGTSYNLPVFLESSVDEMGVMVGFDGDIEQVEQLVNFSYTQTNSTIQVYSTVNPDKLRKIVEQTYTINWGDGLISGLTVNGGVVGQSFPSLSHTYTTSSGYTISITLDAPWTKQKLSKKITVPRYTTITNLLGSFTGTTVPAYSNLTGQTQNYLNDLDITNNTGYTTTGFTYMAVGGSRLDELKKYGSTNNTFNVTNSGSGAYLINGSSNPTLTLTKGQTYTFNINSVGHPFWIKTVSSTGTSNQYNNGITNNGVDSGTITFVVPTDVTSTLYYNCQIHSSMKGTINLVEEYTQTLTSGSSPDLVKFTGYTFTYTSNTTGTTTLQYRDYEDGYTMITGSTTGFTKEEVFNKILTRNEHFLGFIDEPTIYSDLFVERGKQGVMEINLRLGEIDNVGELDIYGNGYFNVRKQ